MFKSNFVKASIQVALQEAKWEYGDETTNPHWYAIADEAETKAMAQAYVSEYDNYFNYIYIWTPDDDSDTMYFMSERARWGRAVLENNWELADKIQASWNEDSGEE